MKIKISIVLLLIIITANAQKVVRYDLYVRDTIVTFGNKPKRAIAVNGQIPMPTLTFTEGDIAEIYVHNKLNEETSMHWHGLFLPNQYDGQSFNTERIGITATQVCKNKSECMVHLL
jgi:FtsP/CotA-like multicopper oxidase with cupredoxin domain